MLYKINVVNNITSCKDCMIMFVCFQIMSIEDVERIMDETKEGIEYQRVGFINFLSVQPHDDLGVSCLEGG